VDTIWEVVARILLIMAHDDPLTQGWGNERGRIAVHTVGECRREAGNDMLVMSVYVRTARLDEE
jgi:hypothetical protein